MFLRLLPLVTIMATPALADSGVQQFGGWMAGCDNERVCTAIRPVWDAVDGLPADPGTPFLQIRHHPHRDATPQITLIDQKNPAPDAVLKPPLATMEILFGLAHSLGERGLFAAHIDGNGGYRFKDEEARSILDGLRSGRPVRIAIGNAPEMPLDTVRLDEVLAYFDQQQELADTPGALVLRPGNVMYDYVHPRPPQAVTIHLTAFKPGQLRNLLAEYPEKLPGETLDVVTEPRRGLATLARYKSADRDCGVQERWGHTGTANEFRLVERREMPVCIGIGQQHWIRTYRADTISPPQMEGMRPLRLRG